MTAQEREKKSEERFEQIIKMLRNNRDPSAIARELASHYLAISRECMNGYTPRSDLRDHWFKFYSKYNKLAEQFTKIEESQ